MFSKIKKFYAVNPRFIDFTKLYCSDKFKKLQEIRIQKDKKSKSLQPSAIIVDSYEECDKFEEDVLKQVLIEKGKDAVLRSRLSKECKTLFTNPADKSAAGKYTLLRLDQIALENGPDCQDWSTFDKFQNKMSENVLLETTKNLKYATSENIQINNEMKRRPDEGGPTKVNGVGGASGGGISATGTMATRPVRQDPGKVIFCFIPEEWWRIFIPKTGVTGFGTFLFAFSTFLVSKEIYILEHYYYHGLSALIIWILILKYIGPMMAKMLDKEVDQFEKKWNEGRVNEKQMLEDQIVQELFLQYQMEGQLSLQEAKRENVKLQLEEEFRRREMMVYNEVKQRLDYHVALELVKQRFQQKNLVEYVTNEVKKAITPEMEKKLIYYSIDRIVDDVNPEKK